MHDVRSISLPYRVFCGTWNVNGRMPPDDLDAWLLEYRVKDGEKHSPPPDIYAIG